ncbi:MAG TPA: hypothetical protein VML58_16985, partial [Burkholderiaceae bacterium]|nr:hypothetical protein [Burkholderiaceae bacterium]
MRNRNCGRLRADGASALAVVARWRGGIDPTEVVRDDLQHSAAQPANRTEDAARGPDQGTTTKDLPDEIDQGVFDDSSVYIPSADGDRSMSSSAFPPDGATRRTIAFAGFCVVGGAVLW